MRMNVFNALVKSILLHGEICGWTEYAGQEKIKKIKKEHQQEAVIHYWKNIWTRQTKSQAHNGEQRGKSTFEQTDTYNKFVTPRDKDI